MEGKLQVKNLTKGQILHGVSFDMARGEMLAVMGPSGSGKSTLLYNVSGMDRPDSGEVWLGGTEIAGLSEDEKAGLRLRRVGFVFQQMNMMANLNILDNILLPAVHANRRRGGKTRAELTAKARALMEKLSIAGLEERSVAEVSGGQLQRACICRSMMNDPEILFADEPTGALNRSAAAEVMGELQKLHREGTAILLVTHDGKVASACDRVLYLLDGRIQGTLRLQETAPAEQREDTLKAWLRELGW